MIVGVMASGKKEPLEDEEKRLANEVGTAIAELGYLTGGGGVLRAKELPQKRMENEPGKQTRTMDLAR
jgi:hypothetical protein